MAMMRVARFSIVAIVFVGLLVGIISLQPQRKTSAHNEMIHPEWPLTLNAAVTRILAKMSQADKASLKAKRKSELIQYHPSLGSRIQDSFGLWKGNYSLLTDCHTSNPDDASTMIIEAVWQKLQTQ